MLHPDNTSFSAAPAAAGYLYQARLALLLSIPFVNSGSDVSVAIEKLDDISFEASGAAIDLLQTKHHIDRVANLTDASPDLWKTLRGWAEAVAKDPSFLSRTRFVLVTTGTAPEGSAASLLRPHQIAVGGVARNPRSARNKLAAIANSSENVSLKSAFAAFKALVPEMQEALLSAVEIVDRQPTLVELGPLLEEALRLVAPRGKVVEARERLEGWWWPRIVAALMAKPVGSISIAEIETKLDDIRDALKRDALITDFEEAELTDGEASEYERFRFVKQLKLVGIGNNRISFAKRDYYRAFSQRSKWLRSHAVLNGELEKFDRMLVEEWQPHFEEMCETVGDGDIDEADLREAGQQVYRWVEKEARFPFRTVNARFICVGSYHILADEKHVGWHRDYDKLIGDD